MHRLSSMCLDAAIAAVALAPLFCFLQKRYFRNWGKTCGYWLFSVYLCAVFSVVGLPDIRYIRFDPNFNFIPFAYMFSDYTASLLNVALFMPLGFFLPVLWSRFGNARKTVLFGFNISLLVEILQIFTFRATDVNDLITNTLGTFLGWCIGMLALRVLPVLHPQEKNGGLRIICSASLGLMVFIHPFLESLVRSLF